MWERDKKKEVRETVRKRKRRRKVAKQGEDEMRDIARRGNRSEIKKRSEKCSEEEEVRDIV